MNKNAQYIVTLSCVVIAVSVVYYVFSYLPERNKVSLQLSLQKQCVELGDKRNKEDQAYEKQNPSYNTAYSGSYIFDKETNDCLYRSIYLGTGGGITKDITDLFTNKSLASYTEDKDSNVVDGNKGDYLSVERSHF